MKEKALLIAIIAIPVFWIVWGLTAKEQGIMGYGMAITATNQEAAELMQLKKPGSYFGTENNKALPAVRGGLKWIFTLKHPRFGFSAVKNHMLDPGDGYLFSATLLLWLIALALIVFWRKRKTRVIS